MICLVILWMVLIVKSDFCFFLCFILTCLIFYKDSKWALFLSCFCRLCMMEIVFTSCCKLVGIMLMLKGERICLLCVNLISLCFPDWKLLLDWVYVEFNELNGASDIDDVLRPDIVSVELRFSDSFPF